LLLVDVEIDVGRVAGAVLGDDEAGADDALLVRILEDEEVLALEGVAHPAVEGADGVVDGRGERLLVVGQVDGVELAGQALQAAEIGLLRVADDVHATRPVRTARRATPGRGRWPARAERSRCARWRCGRCRWRRRGRRRS